MLKYGETFYGRHKELNTSCSEVITKTSLFKYIENFTNKKLKYSDKKFW